MAEAEDWHREQVRKIREATVPAARDIDWSRYAGTVPAVAFAAPAGDDRDQFGAIFPASYPGQCAGCADRIDEGDAIRHSTPHGGYIHEGCEDE